MTTELMPTDEGKTVLSQYGENHYEKDMLVAREAMGVICPEYQKSFDEVMNGTGTYICNILITKRETFLSYCEWLFSILEYVEKHTDPTNYDVYNKRIYALMAERLETVWVHHNKLSVYESTTGCTEEKTETRETREYAESLIDSAKFEELNAFMQDAHNDRPDMFVWASDITGRLGDMLVLGQIYDAEYKIGDFSGCFLGEKKHDDIYRILDELKSIKNAETTDYARLGTIIKENDLSLLMVRMTALSSLPADARMKAYASLAEQFAGMGDNRRTAMYAQMAIQEAQAAQEV